jgi:uroporphyrin-3 C-methyltransferase
MSETQNEATETPVTPAEPVQSVPPVPPAQQQPVRPVPPVPPAPTAPSSPFNLALIVALGALALSGWQIYNTREELASTRQELARRNADPAIKAMAEQVRATDARMALLEIKLNEASSQFATLNTMYQDMTKVRSDWLLSEVGHSLALASQELQLAGNVPTAISALQVVDDRLSTFDRPELISVKKAVAHDLETLRALPQLDTIGLTARIDSLVQNIDQLPLSVDIQRQSVNMAPPSRSTSFWEQLLKDVSSSLGEMVRIRRIDKPEAILLSPDQAFMLRENLKLRLLDARIALLQRNAAPFNADVSAVQNDAQRYFDPSAPATRLWLQELNDLKKAPINTALPDLSDSLKAVNDAQTRPGG